MRQLSAFDKLVCNLDTSLRTLLVPASRISQRENPAKKIAEHPLSAQEKRHIAGLMRVNHAGEVSAQALYQGQALTAKLHAVREQMTDAALEEIDHLAWCEQRLRELGSQPSLLNPLWYYGSLCIGMMAGLAGDRWSLGFVAETERQVTKHLQGHLDRLPPNDHKTQAILNQMQEDETLHAETAQNAGAAELPFSIKKLMQMVSLFMTQSSYYI